VFKNPNLARSYRLLASKGRDAFYKGDIASEIVRSVREQGGLFTVDDLANWKVHLEEPVKTSYKGIDVYKLTVWTQGQMAREQISGEILVREQDLRPLKILLVSVSGSGTDAIRQEAEVEYAMSAYRALMPVAVTHREFRAGQLTADNRFTYTTFRKFDSAPEAGARP